MSERPYVELVLAMSADGKIADAARTPQRIASPRDRGVWDDAMVRADAVLYGSGTLRSVRRSMQTFDLQSSGEPITDSRLNIVVSSNGKFDLTWPFFQESHPRWLVCARVPAPEVTEAFDRVIVCPGGTGQEVDFPSMLGELREAGIERVCCGGGGGLAASMFRHGLVDEYRLTVAPHIVGGRTSPTPVDGEDLPLGTLPKLRVLNHQFFDGEFLIHYEVVRDDG
ncbi:RibD family protein [Arthrobacter sp. R1-13]